MLPCDPRNFRDIIHYHIPPDTKQQVKMEKWVLEFKCSYFKFLPISLICYMFPFHQVADTDLRKVVSPAPSFVTFSALLKENVYALKSNSYFNDSLQPPKFQVISEL